jgi:hypothetical protein
MPPAAGVYSRAEYNIAKQISTEDIGGWHARLRDLYNRAYPGKEVNHNLPLIEKFVTRHINKEVGKFVFERDPATFAAALALAKTKTATDVTFKPLLALTFTLSRIPWQQWPTTELITLEEGEEAVVERAEKAAAAVRRGEKEKQASAGSVTPPPVRSLLAQFGTKH